MSEISETNFYAVLSALEQNPEVRKMKGYSQHGGTSTFFHCHRVAVSSFRLAKALGLRIDEAALARGAMLHDFHLYQREDSANPLAHMVNHPKDALENAETLFDLNEKEKNIIRSHMWPLTLLSVPRSREALLVSIADKYCAVQEFAVHRSKRRAVNLP